MRHSSDRVLNRSLRLNIGFAVGLCCLLLLVGGGWSVSAKVSSAVVAAGTVVVETNTKQIQHQEGGIVGEVLVRNGQHVVVGQPLIRLSDETFRANYDLINKRIVRLQAEQARLLAERAQEQIDLKEVEQNSRLHQLALEEQQDLLQARARNFSVLKEQIDQQVLQLRQQIDGKRAQRTAKEDQIAFVSEEIEDVAELFQRGLVPQSRLLALRRERARLIGDVGQLTAEIAEAEQAIIEKDVSQLRAEEERLTEILEDLSRVRRELGEAEEQFAAARDQLRRTEIRTPVSGRVHQLAAHTIGGVIPPGGTIMSIVPAEEDLVIDVQVSPIDIERVYRTRTARVRFPSLNPRTAPDLSSEIRDISADLVHDEASGLYHYAVRLSVSASEQRRLGDVQLKPGMPVEAFLETEPRTVAAYLIDPLLTQLAHALRER